MLTRSRRSVAIFGVLLLSSPFAPLAGPEFVLAQGLSIGWDDCRTGDGLGSDNRPFGCSSIINSFPLFPAIRLASPVDSVYAMELVIDVDVAADVLPPWWHMEPDSCNRNGWAADATPAPGCMDAWAGLGVASYQGWLPGVPGSSPRHGRLLVAAAAQPGEMVALEANVSYSICRVLLRTINTFTCAGCTTPACLVFNSVLFRRLPGSSFEEVFVASPEAQGSNMVKWQAGTGADCMAVPTRRRAWGAVKALYR